MDELRQRYSRAISKITYGEDIFMQEFEQFPDLSSAERSS